MSELKDRQADLAAEEPCQEVAALLVFYACDELEAEKRAALEQHLKGCAGCAAALARERRLLEAFSASASAEPSPVLLAQCREELDEALDELEPVGAWERLRAAFNPGRWLALHPAWSAALLLVLGIALGRTLPAWFARPAPPALLRATPPGLTDQDLRNAEVSAINWQPGTDSSPPSVEVHLTEERPMVVRGTVNDRDVQRLLMLVVRNERRFDSGVRLDSVELLRSRSDNADVREALCEAARRDPNPGVRLKALEALRGFEQDEEVRQTLLDALVSDTNPGVRIEAINALRQLPEAGQPLSDTRVRQVLEEHMRNDPNNYIRLQCAAAMRELGPRRSY